MLNTHLNHEAGIFGLSPVRVRLWQSIARYFLLVHFFFFQVESLCETEGRSISLSERKRKVTLVIIT